MSKLPRTTKVSFFFGLLTTTPWAAFFCIDVPDGMGALGYGFLFGALLFFISIPAAFISFVTGVTALNETKLSYISVIPTGIYLAFIVIKMTSLG